MITKGQIGSKSEKSEVEALISDTESVGEPEKAKESPEPGSESNEQTAESEFTEEEIKKSEDYKNKGNEYFKCKSAVFCDTLFQNSSMHKQLNGTLKPSFARFLMKPRRFITVIVPWRI